MTKIAELISEVVYLDVTPNSLIEFSKKFKVTIREN